MSRPNIVFILSDDHAAHAISAYGSRVNATPHLDRIAHEGMRLDAVYCTNSICSPSRASILTGTYSHVNGVSSIWTELDYRVPTFVEVLRDEGYRNGMFGKWHLGEHGVSLPRGFDEWRVFPGQGDYVDPAMIDERGSAVVPGYATDIVTDLAIDFIDDTPADQPFCVMVHHKAPHRPWVPDEKHRHLYADGSIPEPETFFDDNEGRSQAVRGVRMTIADDMGADDLKEDVPAHLRGPENRVERMRWKYQIYMRDYLQCVQSIDDNVGRLLDHLDAKGLRENTIVVYTSDQGFFLGDHGWFDKRLMFDQSLQMPMLMRWPAEIEAGTTCEAIITNVDFAATFLDACGVDAAEAMPSSQGRSFRPLLRGERVEDWPEAAYYRYWEHDDPFHAAPAHYGIRTADYKLIYYYGAGLGVPGASTKVFEPEWELYDLRADPEEIRNVADDPAYAEIKAELERVLATYQQRYDDVPYTGPDTVAPVWGPHDRERVERVMRAAP
ncbi:sulfatase [Pseudoclavibacter endophyticus]|uniref:Sulfatase n=1 Tax=Pseudoclavibacter endophyticus TaxID=1778590 RepID=A0A6H9WRX7_9MICO|nr:sulfatase [Pseudoclavibacter endophyticus]KAB1650371.1 sulfatase [Pseudoclavibacter endophyticus]GGA54723.1 sulfatase [Pseudoclavibacter endophyticus]